MDRLDAANPAAGEVVSAFADFLERTGVLSALVLLGRGGAEPILVAAFAPPTVRSRSSSRQSDGVPRALLSVNRQSCAEVFGNQAADPVQCTDRPAANPCGPGKAGTLFECRPAAPAAKCFRAAKLDELMNSASDSLGISRSKTPSRWWREISFDGGGWGRCSLFVPGSAGRPGAGVLASASFLLSRDMTMGRARSDLRERVKELTCLYGISQVALVPKAGIDEIIATVVSLLPPAWLRPEIALGRISFDGRQWLSGAGSWDRVETLRAPIVIEGRVRGFVEVGYPHFPAEGVRGWFRTDSMQDWAGILLSASAKPFLDEEKQLISTVGSQVSIILERMIAEEERVRLEAQVRHADRLATVGQLAAGVAHELNEPLTNILGFAEFIKAEPALPAQASNDIGRIMKAALHAREIVRKLVLFSRQKPPRKGVVDLNSIISEGLFFLDARCQAKGITLEMDLDPALPGVEADPGQIHQILVNLVVNSIQSIHDRGRIVVRTRRGPSGEAVFEVSDDGHGMTPEVRDKVFIPFFTTKDIDQGTGLGLSVVHGIVSSHGGSIEVESEPGVGTTFTVTLTGANRRNS